MSCLPRFLLFDVFYGLFSWGVSVLSDVASCFVFYSFCWFYVFYGVYLGGASVFGDVVFSFVDTPMV